MTNPSTPRVEIRQRSGGGWVYQLFTDDKDPLRFEGDNRNYATPQEAQRAGHEAKEAFIRRMGGTR